jgi:hypothetical protein
MLDDRNMDIQRHESLRLFVVLGTVLEGMGKKRAKPARIPDFLLKLRRETEFHATRSQGCDVLFSLLRSLTFNTPSSDRHRGTCGTRTHSSNYCVDWWCNFAVGSSRNVTIHPFLKYVNDHFQYKIFAGVSACGWLSDARTRVCVRVEARFVLVFMS